jgi:O-methyltransferase
MREFLKRVLPSPVHDAVKILRRRREYPAAAKFVKHSLPHASMLQRMSIVRKAFLISLRVQCPHVQREVLSYCQTILSLPKDIPGVCVEAGCFKGGSTAKFSLAADLAGRELVVFDSFEGIPSNEEAHDKNIFGGKAGFPEGSYCGGLEEVKANVAKYGKIERCRFIKGWFDDTMPHFHEPIATAYIDVDLVSSTKTCIKYLYPLLAPGGVLYSQDGHLPLVIEVFDDDAFWENEVGCKKPRMLGLGTSKLITVFKEPAPATQAREMQLAGRL